MHVFVFTAVAAAGFWFSLGLHPVWWVAWLAPVPLLLVEQNVRRHAFAAAFLGLLSCVPYYRTLNGLTFAFVLVALQAAWWMGVLSLAHRTRHVFAFPVYAAAGDMLVTALSPHASFGSFAHSQGDFHTVRQIAAITGTPGIVFVLACFASAVAWLLRKQWRPAMAPLLVVAAALAFGSFRLRPAPGPASGVVNHGLVALDDYKATDRVWTRYAEGVGEAARRGSSIVLLPEKIDRLDAGSPRLDQLSAAARDHRVWVAAGIRLRENDKSWNRLLLFAPDGRLAAQYDKRHLVPGLEADLTPGSDLVVHEIGGLRYGLAICKDLHFPSFGRAYAERGVDVILAPAWDFGDDAWMAARLSALRGVESGFTIVRASREGLLNITDQRGRPSGEAPSRWFPGTVVNITTPVAPGAPTFYARFGDVFGWACVAAAVTWRALLRAYRPE